MCWAQKMEINKRDVLPPPRNAWPGWEGGGVVAVTICHRGKDSLTARLKQRTQGCVATLHAWFSGTTLLSNVLFHYHMVCL